jgi:transcriptional regulator with XRE-family HTH domain
MERFAENLRMLRRLRRMTQEDLSKASLVRVTQISAYENGKEIPSLRTMRKLAEALEVRLGVLIDGQISFLD